MNDTELLESSGRNGRGNFFFYIVPIMGRLAYFAMRAEQASGPVA